MVYTSEVGFLDITDFIACGAGCHYHGKLLFYTENGKSDYERVEGELTQEWADRLNKDDMWHTGFHKGDTSGRFYDRELLIEHAIETIKDKAPYVKLLLEGAPCNVGPCEIIMCKSTKLKRLGGQLLLAYDKAIDDFDEKKEGAVLAQWWKLLARFGFPREGD